MSSPTQTNRLRASDGSYLEFLAEDPVNWQPWEPEAFEVSRHHDVPIFLSIGYPLSPWCRRMHLESFRDETVASTLNGSFVSIAVDRDSRPDVDTVYQTVARAVEDGGGWPLSAWLTPDGEPFYIGTYFPPNHTDYAPGFKPLLQLIESKWDRPGVRSELEERATTWASYAHEDLDLPEVDDTGGWDDPIDPLAQVARVSVRAADPEYGGWGTASKSPEPVRLQTLLETSILRDVDGCWTVAISTLDAIADGQIHDHVGGGMFLYCRERDWSKPVVEKSLATNATVARAFLLGYQITREPRYARVARGAIEFLERALGTQAGGFMAGLGHEDGDIVDPDEMPPDGYYRWTAETVENAIDDPGLAALVCERLGIPTDNGSIHGVIPRVTTTLEDLATSNDQPPSELRQRLELARDQLRTARARRSPRPQDRRVFVAWNGLAMRTLAEASVVLSAAEFAERAESTCESLRDRLWDGYSLTARHLDETGSPGESRPVLDDYAHLGRGALACFETTDNRDMLEFAIDLGHSMVEQYWDGRRLSRTGRHPTDDLLVSPQVTRDGIAMGEIPATIELLRSLDSLIDEDTFSEVTERAASAYRSRIRTDLLDHHGFASVLELVSLGATEG